MRKDLFRVLSNNFNETPTLNGFEAILEEVSSSIHWIWKDGNVKISVYAGLLYSYGNNSIGGEITLWVGGNKIAGTHEVVDLPYEEEEFRDLLNENPEEAKSVYLSAVSELLELGKEMAKSGGLIE